MHLARWGRIIDSQERPCQQVFATDTSQKAREALQGQMYSGLWISYPNRASTEVEWRISLNLLREVSPENSWSRKAKSTIPAAVESALANRTMQDHLQSVHEHVKPFRCAV